MHSPQSAIPALGPFLSLIVPTRGRPEQLKRFLASLDRTVADPGSVELVIVVDADDTVTGDLPACRIPVRRCEVEPGLSMGQLNTAGYEQAAGAWIFLLNDDVEVETPDWDRRIKELTRIYADEICLIHVNDGIFQDKLCTFPLVSRTFCELVGGICPREYNRYRIDDHIYNIFNLLSFAGYNRVLYADELRFEHLNRDMRLSGVAAYQPNPIVHAIDTSIFDDLLGRRKEAALDLADHIESVRRSERRQIMANRLIEIADSVSLRRPEYVTRVNAGTVPLPGQPRVTIGIVSADIRSDFAQLCLESVKRHTSNFDLILLDNNRGPGFNHPREMNRILAASRTDFLVLMDDDVIVEAGWLDGMMKAMTQDVGVVTPIHKDRHGRISYAGIVLSPDDTGHHSHDFEVPAAPQSIQTLCSAIMLIDVRKCGHIRVDESYSKYFLDIDYGLRIWEAGYRVVQTSHTMVTHIGGATLPQGSALSDELYEAQRQRFVERWMRTGRWHRLLGSPAWMQDPHLRAIVNFPDDVRVLIASANDDGAGGFEEALRAVHSFVQPRPALRHWAQKQVEHLGSAERPVLTPGNRRTALLAGYFIQPVLVEAGYERLNIVLHDGEYFAVPADEGSFDSSKVRAGGYSRAFVAKDVETLKIAVAAGLSVSTHPVRPSSARLQAEMPAPFRVVEHGYKGFNILEHGRVHAVRQADGAYDSKRLMNEGELGRIAAGSVSELKAKIDNLQPRLIHRGYRGYDLIEIEAVYAVPQYEGEFDPVRARSGGYFGVLVAASADELRQKIDGLGRRHELKLRLYPWRRLAARIVRRLTGSSPVPVSAAVPALERAEPSRPSRKSGEWLARSPARMIERDVDGFALFQFEYKIFAVPHGIGTFNYQAFKADGRLASCLIGQSPAEVRALISQRSASGRMPRRYVVFGTGGLDQEKLPLAPAGSAELVRVRAANQPTIGNDLSLPITAERDAGRYLLSSEGAAAMAALSRSGFTDAVVFWSGKDAWVDNSIETVAARLAPVVHVVTPDGGTRQYVGEGVHRLVYNKAYLASLFSRIPMPRGLKVLEIGCSDGMVCDLMALLGAAEVTGIDIMETAGCQYPRPEIRYLTADAHALPFDGSEFDLVISIATFEHLAQPRAVFGEILRVLRPGGHAYVQAGPLYHSPFGHHMFGYFDDMPWVHLRLTPEEIARRAEKTDASRRISADHACAVSEYVRGMLSEDHLNGLRLADYRLDELKASPAVEVIFVNLSHEGEDLLSPAIRVELSAYDPDTLTQHGFEVLMKKTG